MIRKSRLIALAAVPLLIVTLATTSARADSATGSISGVATSADSGTPLSGIPVTLVQSATEDGDLEPLGTTATAADGSYTFTGLAARAYLVCFDFTGGAYESQCWNGVDWIIQSDEGFYHLVPGTEITVADGQQVSGINASLHRSSFVSGRVMNARGVPVTNAQVHFGPGVNTEAFDAFTNSSGYYSIEVLPTTANTPYLVCAYPFHATSDGFPLDDSCQSAVSVAPEATTELDFVMGPASGVVPDSQTMAYSDPDPVFTYQVFGVTPPDYLVTPPVCGAFDQGPREANFEYEITCHGGTLASGLPFDESSSATLYVTLKVASLPLAAIKQHYSTKLTTTGGDAPYTYALADGKMPPGLALSKAGAITGTPTAVGNYTLDLKVSDSDSRNRIVETLQVPLVVTPMRMATTTLAPAPIDTTYVAHLLTAGGTLPWTWVRTSGSLPPGLKLSAAGQISGKATVAGTYTFGVQVTDNAKPRTTASQVLTLVVTPLTITTASLPSGTKGVNYHQALTVSGGSGTRHWKVSAGSLPPGITLNSLGVVGGKPTTAGTYTFTITLTDTSKPVNTATATYTVTIS